MKNILNIILILMLFAAMNNAKNYDEDDLPVQLFSSYQYGKGGLWLPSRGNMHVLIVFAEFPDDRHDTTNTRWVKGQTPQNMTNWVDQTWSSNPTQGSLTHYFNEMSQNQFHFTGKTVHVVAPHSRKWYKTNTKYRGEINKELIQSLDATEDFSDYDNWDLLNPYSHDNNPDNIVDMIIMIYRNVGTDSTGYYSDLGFATNYADVGGSTFTVEGGTITVKTSFEGSGSTPYGSGVTINGYFHQDPFRVTIHEFAHYLLGHNDMHNGFGFWGMLCGWGTKSYVANAFERYQLNWMSDSASYTISTSSSQTLSDITLDDFITNGHAYKIDINTSSNQYFYVEYHGKSSYWENNAPFNPSHPNSTDGLVEEGIYIIRQNGIFGSGRQCIPADGRHNWEVNQSVANPWGAGYLPVFKKLDPNISSGYHDLQQIPFSYGGLTSPDAIHFIEDESGNPVPFIPHNGDGFDAFRMNHNQVFTPWSNPNNQMSSGSTTNFGFYLQSITSQICTLNVYINTSQSAPPSKPQNLQISWENNHPRLDWDANLEPDLARYKIYKNPGTGYSLFTTTTNNYYVDNTEFQYSGPPDTKVWVYYKVSAEDNTNNESLLTNEVKAAVNQEQQIDKTAAVDNLSNQKLIYQLTASYPNPRLRYS